jgi:hypothetical protein
MSDRAGLQRIHHLRKWAITLSQTIFMPSQLLPWKQSSFRSDHKDQSTAELNIFKTPFLLLLIHQRATDSKSLPICKLKIREITPQVWLATKHSKNGWVTDSETGQNKHVRCYAADWQTIAACRLPGRSRHMKQETIGAEHYIYISNKKLLARVCRLLLCHAHGPSQVGSGP